MQLLSKIMKKALREKDMSMFRKADEEITKEVSVPSDDGKIYFVTYIEKTRRITRITQCGVNILNSVKSGSKIFTVGGLLP